MVEKPNLSDDKIVACLDRCYNIPVSAIEFLPIGNDSSAWVYRICAEAGGYYFLKVKRGGVSEVALFMPRYLKDTGLKQVVAPLPTVAQALSASAGDFTLILYPFIEGNSGMEIGLNDNQWIEYGSFLNELHSTGLPDHLSRLLPRETFVPRWAGVVRELEAKIGEDHGGLPERELSSIWKEKREVIRRILQRAEGLGRTLQDRSLEFVVCHADIHTANLLIDYASDLFVVDWDGLIFAPKERDLMFVVGSTIGSFAASPAEVLFFKGYGETEINWHAFAYYRYEWVVQEIGDYGGRVFLMSEAGQDTKAQAVQGFLELFQPGNVVESAYASERQIRRSLSS